MNKMNRTAVECFLIHHTFQTTKDRLRLSIKWSVLPTVSLGNCSTLPYPQYQCVILLHPNPTTPQHPLQIQLLRTINATFKPPLQQRQIKHIGHIGEKILNKLL